MTESKELRKKEKKIKKTLSTFKKRSWQRSVGWSNKSIEL